MLEKGGMSILSGAGGTAAKIVLNLIFEGTTDATAAKLAEISDKLSVLKSKIKDIPHAAAVYNTYYEAIHHALTEVSNIKELLTFSNELKVIYGTEEAYLSTLREEHWRRLIDFLSVNLGNDYITLINNMLRSAYGLTIREINESNTALPIKFGEADRSYARTMNIALLAQDNLPVNVYDFVEEHLQIRHTVTTALSAVILCSDLIFNVFESVEKTSHPVTGDVSNVFSLFSSLPPEIQKGIQNRLTNAEVNRHLFDVLANISVQLLPKLHDAPFYLCGNSFRLYQAMQSQMPKFSLRNIATKTYLALSGPEGFSIANKIAGHCDFWSMAFNTQPVPWVMENKLQTNPNHITLTGPNGGYLYIDSETDGMTYSVLTSPSKTDFGQPGWGSKSHTWHLQMVPRANVKQGKGEFAFLLTNTSKKQAVVNKIPFIGSAGIGPYTLDPFDGNHQWDITVVS